MKHLTFIAILLLCLSACGGNKNHHTTLTGRINGLGQDTIYLYGTDKYYDRIDTLAVKEDQFTTMLSTDTLTMVQLQFSNGETYPIFIDKGNKITIKGDKGNLHNLQVDGNPQNIELTAFHKELNTLKDSSLFMKKTRIEKFIQSHPFSLVSIHLLDRHFVQTQSPDYDKIKRLAEGLSGELKDRPYITELLELLKNEDKKEIGKSIPYFHMTNAKGKSITRSNFKDKHILMHFWASWDASSKEYNAMYRRIYQKEKKNKKLAIVGISLDLDEKAWKACIKQDTLQWEQLCSFNGWNSELIKQLAIKEIPYNLLISPTGHIEAVNLDESGISERLKRF